MDFKRLKRTILPLAFVAFMLFLTYWCNQWYAEAHGIVGVDYSFVFLSFNEAVPFLAWTIWPYVIAYPFWILTFVYLGYRNKANMYKILIFIIVTFTVCGLTYFFFQSDVQAWRETSGLFGRDDLNFSESLMMLIYNAAGPRNANPSMHCLMSWLCILGARLDKTMPKPAKITIWIIGIAICLSTQTLKQHYIIDLITGVALAEAAYWIFRNSRRAGQLEHFFTGINQKLHLE